MIGILIHAGHAVQPLRVKDASELIGINNRVELAAVGCVFARAKRAS